MEAVLRRLKLKKGEPQDTEARKRLQQDLFAFDQVHCVWKFNVATVCQYSVVMHLVASVLSWPTNFIFGMQALANLQNT